MSARGLTSSLPFNAPSILRGLLIGLILAAPFVTLPLALHAEESQETQLGPDTPPSEAPVSATPASGPHFRLPDLSDRPDYTGVVFHRCLDGDTCIITLPDVQPIFGNQVPLHLAGIKAPRLNGQCARETLLEREARDLITTMLRQARSIELYNTTRPDSFEVVGRLVVDGTDLSQLLIDRGLALPADADMDHRLWCDQ